MVKVEIKKEEIDALDKLLSDAQTPVQMGFYLATFRIRIQQVLQAEREKIMKQQAMEMLKNEKGKDDRRGSTRSSSNNE